MFDEPHALVRALAFADLYSEPEDNPFWNFEKSLDAQRLSVQVQWMQYIQGRYSKILLKAHEDRYEDLTSTSAREEADQAILKAFNYLEKYLAKHLPEAYLEIQSYEAVTQLTEQEKAQVNQFKGIVNTAVPTTVGATVPELIALLDRPQITRTEFATMLRCSERYIDDLEATYESFPRSIQYVPRGTNHYWLEEALAFKRGDLFKDIEREWLAKKEETEREWRAKKFDKPSPEEGLAKRKQQKRPARKKKPDTE